MPGAKQRHEHFADRPVYDLGIRRWLSDFLDHWLQCGVQRPRLVAAE
jgi:GMP synthase (glutamine-hydrolysing)